MYNNYSSESVLGSRLRDGITRNGLSIFDRKQKSFLLYILPTGSEAQSASHSVCTVGFFPGIKRPEGEVNISKV
jgi:hypothetical protein